ETDAFVLSREQNTDLFFMYRDFHLKWTRRTRLFFRTCLQVTCHITLVGICHHVFCYSFMHFYYFPVGKRKRDQDHGVPDWCPGPAGPNTGPGPAGPHTDAAALHNS
uniref:Uncharacterized protein n=1 Tax=Sphaeramia orbicularis TaxID=375764 RepID=A0A673BEF0_9TELE